jgi:mannose-6-phosphate isomerase-like protein (cupin superfamily)
MSPRRPRERIKSSERKEWKKPMEASLPKLQRFAGKVLVQLGALPEGRLYTLLHMRDYHGFNKSGLPPDLTEPLFNELGVEPSNVQAEIVRVSGDLRRQVHLHRHASAYIVFLGRNVGLDDPKLASAFLEDRWFPVEAGQQLEIPAGTPHGFTTAEHGVLYFLSVQSPPIIGLNANDDYVLVDTP